MKPKDEKPKGDQTAIKLRLDPNKPEGNRKSLGAGRNAASPALLAASSEMPMPILDEARLPIPLGWGEVPNRNDHQPHAKRPRRASLQSQIETNR